MNTFERYDLSAHRTYLSKHPEAVYELCDHVEECYAEIDRLAALVPTWRTGCTFMHSLPDYGVDVLLIFGGESTIQVARLIRSGTVNMWSYTGSDGKPAEARIQQYDRWMYPSEVAA